MNRLSGTVLLGLGQVTILLVSLNWSFSWEVGWFLFLCSLIQMAGGTYLVVRGDPGRTRYQRRVLNGKAPSSWQ